MHDSYKPGQFRPGIATNPSGLGKPDLAKAIRAILKPEDVASFLVAVASGEPTQVPGRPEMITLWSREDRRWAIDKLITRGWGKEKQIVEVTGADGAPLFDPATLPTDALEHYQRCTAALAAPAPEESRGGGETEPSGGSGAVPEEPPAVH